MRRAMLSVLAFLGGVGAAHAAPLAFTHIRLIDGSGGPPVEDGAVVIDAGKIVAVGRDVRAPAKARIVDMGGRTATPGLITDHAHLGLADGITVTADHYNRANILRQLRQYEAYGLTTVTAPGLNRSPLFDSLRVEMHADTIPGADLFGVDQGIGVPDGGPPKAMLPVGEDQIFRPSTPAEARQAVDLMASRGREVIKLWLDDFRNGVDKAPLPKMKPEIYRAVVDEAHAKNLRVAAHIHDLDDAKNVVAAGVDIIAHGVRDRPVDKAFVQALKTRGVWYIRWMKPATFSPNIRSGSTTRS